jgi:hypothetical protein
MFNFGIGCHICHRNEADARFAKDARTGETLYWAPGVPRRIFCSPACALKFAQQEGMVSDRKFSEAAPNGETPPDVAS